VPAPPGPLGIRLAPGARQRGGRPLRQLFETPRLGVRAMTDRYAVFGNPVAHSRSPDIHAFFAAATGQDLVYDRQLVAVGGFASAARAFFAAGGKGLNVTLPFKEDAFAFADTLSPRARRAGAVNTLALRDDGVLGDN